jgi:Tfp pilus assembly protein PilF
MKPSNWVHERWVFSTALVIGLAGPGCSSPLVQGPMRLFQDLAESSGERQLNSGIADYDNGDYMAASKDIRSALDLGLNLKRQAEAHKYLAFIDCTSRKQLNCRDHFRKAIEADPGFHLGPAEAGHPIWGQVYRSVKAETTKHTSQR